MIFDAIQEWFQELLIDGIISNLTGMFDTLNTKVGEIAGEVGMTPSAWNSGIFNMVRSLSETVIVPIAGIVLTFVMCYELIQLIVEKNNLHDFDTWIFFKWIFKTFCAVLIVTNTWNIVMAVFDVAQNVVSQSAGVIISDAGIDISGVTADLETQLADWSIGALLGLWFQSIFVGLCTQILSICIFLVIYGRMIEVYLVTSIGPIPFATMANREWGNTGQNYLRSLLALGFQAFLIMICVGIYAVLVEGISLSGDNISGAIWGCMGYTVLLCFTLFKTPRQVTVRGALGGGRYGEEIQCHLRGPALVLQGMEQEGCGPERGKPLSHHEHRGHQGAARIPDCGRGLRPVPLDHLPHAPGGLGRYGRLGLHLQDGGLRVGQAMPQIG